MAKRKAGRGGMKTVANIEKKRTGKKVSKNISIVVISVIILALLIYLAVSSYVSNKNKQEAIKEENRFFYDSLSCISGCPVTVVLGDPVQVVFESDCENKCRIQASLYNIDFSKVNSSDKGLMINSNEFVNCRQYLVVQQNADKYRLCLVDILPGLKDKFGI